MMFTYITPVLAAAAQPMAQNPTGEMLKMLGLMGFIFFFMYFTIIRPQQKKQKELAEMLKTLKTGDKVVSSGGIVGVVISVKDKHVTVRSADTKLELLKSAIAEITERSAQS